MSARIAVEQAAVKAGEGTAGHFSHDGGHFVSDNLAEGDAPGFAYAASAFDSWWINPRLRAGYEVALNDLTLIPTIEASYAAQFVQGYTETGGSFPLSVDSHVAAVGEVQAELAARTTIGAMTLEAELGYAYRLDLGEPVPVKVGDGTSEMESTYAGGESAYAGIGVSMVNDGINLALDARGTMSDGVVGSSLTGSLSVQF